MGVPPRTSRPRLRHERWSKTLWHRALQPLALRLEEAVLLEAGLRVDLLADLREAPAPALSERFSEPLVRLMEGRLLLIELFSRPVGGTDVERATFAAVQARERFGRPRPERRRRSEVAVLLLGWGRRQHLWEQLPPWPDAHSDFGRRLRSPSGVPLVIVDVEAVPMEAGWAVVALSSRLDALGGRLTTYLKEEAQMGEAVRKLVEEAAEEFKARPGETLLETMRRLLREAEEAERRARLAEQRGEQRGIRIGEQRGEQRGRRAALLQLAEQLLDEAEARRLAEEPDLEALQRKRAERLRATRTEQDD